MRAAGREGEGAFLDLQLLSLPEAVRGSHRMGYAPPARGVARRHPGLQGAGARSAGAGPGARACGAHLSPAGGRVGGRAREPSCPLTWRPLLTWRRARPRPPAPPSRPPPLAAAGHLRPDPPRAADAPEEPPRPALQGDPPDDPRPAGRGPGALSVPVASAARPCR